MDEYLHDGWRIAYDADATREVYASSRGGAHDCTCSYCRNFVEERDKQYPAAFLALLAAFGVDPHKEAEVSEMGPGEAGRRHYSGFYHFVGEVREDPGDRMSSFRNEATGSTWDVFFRNQRSLAFEAFGDRPVVQLEFSVELPWVLAASELTAIDP